MSVETFQRLTRDMITAATYEYNHTYDVWRFKFTLGTEIYDWSWQTVERAVGYFSTIDTPGSVTRANTEILVKALHEMKQLKRKR